MPTPAPIRVNTPDTAVLVCATTPASDEPLVVLANGSYETDVERVFWSKDPRDEVLRLPLSVPVSVRPVRRFAAVSVGADANEALAEAVRGARLRLADVQPGAGALEDLLAAALRAGDASTSTLLASLVVGRRSVAVVYQVMSDCLGELGQAWAEGRGPVLAERAATHAAQAVCEHLRTQAPAPSRCGTVVLAAPPGERHTLALGALAHQLQEAGHQTHVVDDLPLDELCQLASEQGTAAVVLSAHIDLAPAAARRLLAALRQAAPGVLLAGGGPGFPTTAGADLVTDDVAVLLSELDHRASALTAREREVLLAVADGYTNAEIAAQLGVSPATVKTHLDHVFAKTRTEHRAAAVARALRQGWIR